jgi:N-acetylmuramoyl-L-alanine amidase
MLLTLEESDVNITGLRMSARKNGTLIQIFSTRKFNAKDIEMDIRNGYFHIDIYGAQLDTARIAAIPGSGIISKIEAFQLGETAAIGFKLREDIISKELVFSETDNDIYVNLRTHEEIEEKPQDRIKEELAAQKRRWYIDTIVIDAGHGGKDPGAIGYSKSREKDIVLPIAMKLGDLIKANFPKLKVVYTRKKDVFIPLWKRTKIANDVEAQLFISIHCNSNNSRRPNGFETYFLSADKDSKATDVVLKENSAIEFEESQDRARYEGLNYILATLLQNDNLRRSQFLASNIQNALEKKLKKLGMKNRGVKQGPFWVLVGATMPNVLVETGYISNKHEDKLLSNATTRKKIAEGIFEGLRLYKDEIEKAI